MTTSRFPLTVIMSVLVASVITTLPVTAQKMALRWKYSEGSSLVYRVTNHQEMDLAAMGGTASSEQIQTMRWQVVEVAPNGDATVKVTTERIQIEARGMTGNFQYDSETGEVPDNPQAKMMASMVGVSYSMVIGPNGKVMQVMGLDEMRDRMFSAMPADQRAMLANIGEQMFSDESMTRMMQQSVQLFPEEPIGPEDTWDSSFSVDIPVLGRMTTNMTFTLTGFSQREGRTIAAIATAGELIMGGDAATPIPMTFDIGNSTMTGTMDFDVDRGLAVAGSMTMNMKMMVGAAGQEMSVGMVQGTGIELVEYAAGR